MEARVNEIFSSFQGEGVLVGRRQIFIRFSGCNLDCNYCDTPISRDPLNGKLISKETLYDEINNLITPDFHSISFTGGEPLLHADFIRNFLEEYEFKSFLETNGSLPEELGKIAGLLDYVSIDIKLPEHEASKNWNDLLGLELESIKLLRDEEINTYCKVVVTPETKLDTIGFIASKIADEAHTASKLSMVLQPMSPFDLWAEHIHRLFEISEEAGKYIDVLTIPQVHKLLNIR